MATLPTQGGMEDVVMRLLANSEPIQIDKLGLLPFNLDRLKAAIAKPYGIFFVCGPTGSGKTTTLPSILNYINTPDTKIWTVEDPVEITQKGLRQVQVTRKAGIDFANSGYPLWHANRAGRDNLRAGDQTALQSLRLPEMETVQEQLVSSLARMGSIQNRLERSADEFEDFNLQVQTQWSNTIDADFAEVVMQLNAHSNAYRAALYAASQAIQPSLMDFVE